MREYGFSLTCILLYSRIFYLVTRSCKTATEREEFLLQNDILSSVTSLKKFVHQVKLPTLLVKRKKN